MSSEKNLKKNLSTTSLAFFDSESPIDFVLVYDKGDTQFAGTREAFESALSYSGLLLNRETIDAEIYVLITAPFERLAFEAERVKLEMDLKGCSIEKSLGTCVAKLGSYLETDDEVDFVSGPFERSKLHLFEGEEDPATFFRPAQRSLLVHHILINIDYDNKNHIVSRDLNISATHPRGDHTELKQIGLPFLLISGAYKDAFILHSPSAVDPANLKLHEKFPQFSAELMSKVRSDPRKEMNETWLRFFKFQPMWKIRNYFGEKIAFYFAWEGLYISLLWPPAIFGLLSFIYGFYKARQTSTYDSCSCNCPLNGTESNGSDIGYVCKQVERPDSFVATFYDTIEETCNNDLNSWFALLICVWGTVFMELWKRKNFTLAYEWDVNGFETTEPDRPEFFGTKRRLDPVTKEVLWSYPAISRIKRQAFSIMVIIFMMCLVFLTIALVILLQVRMRLTWNCVDAVSIPSCTTLCVNDYKGPQSTCFTMTAILPAMINALLVVFWEQVYTKIAHRLTNMENHQTQSDHNDALVLKLFAFQFVNSYTYLAYIMIFRPKNHNLQSGGIFGLGDSYMDVCLRTRCMSYLSVQILLLMITKPIIKIAYDVLLPWLIKKGRLIWSHISFKLCIRKHLVRKKSSLFSPETFGLNYLRKERNKPPLGDFALEAFSEKVIQFGYVIMFTIAFPLAPVVALIVSLFDLRFDAHRLLWFNRRPVAFIASDIGTWQPILQFINFCGVISNSFLIATASGLTKDMTVENKLLMMLGFEHIIFFLMYVCQVIIPDAPSRVKEAIRREKHQVNKILADGYIPISQNSLNLAASVPVTRVSSLASDIFSYGGHPKTRSTKSASVSTIEDVSVFNKQSSTARSSSKQQKTIGL